MSEDEYQWLNSGVLYATWQALGIAPMQRTNGAGGFAWLEVQADSEHLKGELAALLARGGLPALPDGHEYVPAFDGLHVRAVSHEVHLV